MTPPEFHVWDLIKDYVVGLVLFVFSLFGIQMRRNQARIDELEKSCVPRPEFNGTVDSIRNRINETEKTMTDRIDAGNKGTHERLDKLLLQMAGDKD